MTSRDFLWQMYLILCQGHRSLPENESLLSSVKVVSRIIDRSDISTLALSCRVPAQARLVHQGQRCWMLDLSTAPTTIDFKQDLCHEPGFGTAHSDEDELWGTISFFGPFIFLLLFSLTSFFLLSTLLWDKCSAQYWPVSVGGKVWEQIQSPLCDWPFSLEPPHAHVPACVCVCVHTTVYVGYISTWYCFKGLLKKTLFVLQ